MTPAPEYSRDQQSIQKKVDEFVAAWNRHDAHAMSAVYADNADMINPFGRMAHSRTEIEALFKDEQAKGMNQTQFSAKLQGIRFLRPDIAVADYSYEVTGARSVRGYFTDVLEKHGDSWEVVNCRAMTPAPMPEPR